MKVMDRQQTLQQRIDNLMDRFRKTPEFELEGMLLSVNEQICKTMDDRGLSKSDLANLLNNSPAWVTKLLSGDQNLTLKTLATIACVLDLTVEINLLERRTGVHTERIDYSGARGAELSRGANNELAIAA